MRLTKRQLKRIIREEYSKLKRRGLIRENLGETGSIIVDYTSEELYGVQDEEEQKEILKRLASGPGWTVEVLSLSGPAGGAPTLELSGDKEAIKQWYIQDYMMGDSYAAEEFEEFWEPGSQHPDRAHY